MTAAKTRAGIRAGAILVAAGLLAVLSQTAAAVTWDIQTVDSAGSVGLHTSLALDASGNPRISYLDLDSGNLKYAAWNGSAWAKQTVDSAGDVGYYTSLALDASGNPRISYWDVTNYDLKYAAWNVGPGWVTQTVDSAGYVGGCASLALDASGNPRISYSDYTNEDLKYAELTSDPIPEPVTMAGLFFGLASLGAYIRRRRPAASFRQGTEPDASRRPIAPVQGRI